MYTHTSWSKMIASLSANSVLDVSAKFVPDVSARSVPDVSAKHVPDVSASYVCTCEWLTIFIYVWKPVYKYPLVIRVHLGFQKYMYVPPLQTC